MANESDPLTEEDLEGINESLALLDRADRIIDRSARAGIDMTKQRQESTEKRRQLMALKQSFFPGR